MGVGGELAERPREGHLVLRRDEETLAAGLDRLRHARHRGGDDREPSGHRFEDGDGEALVGRGQDEEVSRGIGGVELGAGKL